MNAPIIWLDGLIGSGKTTLAKKLADELDFVPLFESVDGNPYLELFYKDPKRWAFPWQIDMLQRRYALHVESTPNVDGLILDRSLPGDRVFAKMHRLSGNITSLEWQTYDRLYKSMQSGLTQPDILIYLDVEPEIALHRIQKRSRAAEAGISINYLRQLSHGYLDLMYEIESGEHPWANGMDVMRLNWNSDDQPIAQLVQTLQGKLKDLGCVVPLPVQLELELKSVTSLCS